MLVIVITVVSQGFSVPQDSRGEFPLELWTINSGVFQAVGVISFGMRPPRFQVCGHQSATPLCDVHILIFS